MKRILIVVLGLALVGAAVGYALWNKPHENMDTAKADVAIEASALFKAYNTDEAGANAQYLGKTIAVTGSVKEVTQSEGASAKVILDTGDAFGVICELDALAQHPRTNFSVGENVTFKGKCDGLNLDVQLSRCVESK